ncbi:cytochrome c554/c'-like protein [Chitinophaga skermanii]|uniref:Cytochrome c554/c'-like protein n=1 Tax=Chitinophaga skermanii TaxID=331697 RepID=A0A327QXN4_9BACT|nr:multiheme c-type cytochrome [Chitinophaga skermanii]RAJ08725.1 cytochrome c554/c'-like protein [Chitinophaga skermanii]
MKKRSILVFACIVCCIVILSRCIGSKPADPRGPVFAENTSCRNCHQAVYDGYLSTAHYATSHIANPTTVLGPFTTPGNIFHFANGDDVVMEKEGEQLYQVWKQNGVVKDKKEFAIAVGSGRKAQTFLYWQDGKYFQLPISYFVTTNQWANSPGFPADHPMFDRMIPSTCFGCHSSMVGVQGKERQGMQELELFEKGVMMGGIDCQRCHGPGAEHVAFHQSNPNERTAHFMTKIDQLTNMQKLDMCALCHSGLKPMQRPAFEFKPGDALADFLMPIPPMRKNVADLDVHGNQMQLLAASKCFQSSVQTMNCTTCHNPHVKERDNLAVFATRCMTCHNETSHNECTQKHLGKEMLVEKCIDCHMPLQASNAITLLSGSDSTATPDMIRTHLIAVYKDPAQKIMAKLPNGK